MSPPYLVDELHLAIGADGAVRLVQYEVIVDHRLVRLPRQCPDCNGGPPETVTPPPGYDAAIVMIHDATCPVLGALALRQEGGDAA